MSDEIFLIARNDPDMGVMIHGAYASKKDAEENRDKRDGEYIKRVSFYDE